MQGQTLSNDADRAVECIDQWQWTDHMLTVLNHSEADLVRAR